MGFKCKICRKNMNLTKWIILFGKCPQCCADKWYLTKKMEGENE